MEKVLLEGTDLEISRVGLGAMTFGEQTSETLAREMIACSVDHGINFIDTANVYSKGNSETIIGKAIQSKRNNFILATKIGIDIECKEYKIDLSPKSIQRQIEGCLRRLKTDYIDILYLHLPDENTPIIETLQTLEKYKAKGQFRYLGVSNYSSSNIQEMLQLLKYNNGLKISVVQAMYNLLARNIEPELIPICKANAIPIISNNPLAGGLLSNKYNQQIKPNSDNRMGLNQRYFNYYWKKENFAAIEALVHKAQDSNHSLLSIAFCWLFYHTYSKFLLIGASKIEHLKQNLATFSNGTLPKDIIKLCDELWEKTQEVAPSYYYISENEKV